MTDLPSGVKGRKQFQTLAEREAAHIKKMATRASKRRKKTREVADTHKCSEAGDAADDREELKQRASCPADAGNSLFPPSTDLANTAAGFAQGYQQVRSQLCYHEATLILLQGRNSELLVSCTIVNKRHPSRSGRTCLCCMS